MGWWKDRASAAGTAAAFFVASLSSCGGGGGGGGGPSAPTSLGYFDPSPIYGLCGAIPPNAPSVAGGSPSEYTVQPALPSGLVLDPSTGVISGAPTTLLAPTSFRIRASNSAGTASTMIEIEVVVADPVGLGYGPLGASFGVGLDTVLYPVLASGVANRWTHVSGSLPPGITFDPSTGALAGSPLAIPSPSSGTVTIRAENTCTGASTSADVFVEIRNPWPRAAYLIHEAEPVLSTYLPERASGLLRPRGWTEAADSGPAEIACSPDGKWLFVAEGDRTSVRTYALSQLDGRPAETAHSETTGDLPPIDLAVDPSSRFLYAITGEGIVAQLAIGAGGALSPIPGPQQTGEDPACVVVDPLGRFAWVSNTAGGSVSCYSIDPGDGALSHVADVDTASAPLGMAVTPDGAWVYVACLDGASIAIFAVQPGGALAPAGTRATSAGHSPASLAMHPSGRFLYVAHAFDAVVEQFAVSSGSGALSPLSPASVALPGPATRIDCDPEGGLVYALSQRHGWSVFAPAPDGRLLDTPVGSISTRGNTRAIAFQPGRAPAELEVEGAYTASSDGQIFQYRVAGDGALSAWIPPSVAGAGENARWVEAHPWLAVLYAASENPSGADDALARFGIQVGGTLEWKASGGTQTGGRSLQLDPSGRFAFQVLDGSPGRVRTLRVGADGALEATSSTDTSAGPRAMAIHPAGRYAYVPCFDADVIDVFEIDWATGALVPLTSVLTGDGPVQVAIPGNGTHLVCLESASSTAVVYRLHEIGGWLEPLPGGFNDLGSGVTAIEIDPTAEHVFASGVGGSLTRAYRLDTQTGALFPTGHELSTSAATTLRIAPNGRDLFAVFPGGTIERYEYDPSSGLALRESIPAGTSPEGIALRIRVR